MRSHTGDDARSVADKVLDVLDKYSLSPPEGTTDRRSEGRAFFRPIVNDVVSRDQKIRLILPAFPFKSPNSKEKTLGVLPDKAEELSLAHLNGLCKSITDVYRGGAELVIVSDGLVYGGNVSLVILLFPCISTVIIILYRSSGGQ